MTINNLFTYLILSFIAISLLSVSLFLYFSKKELTKKHLLFKSISAWLSLVGVLVSLLSGLYYQFGYEYKKSDLPVSYLTKTKSGFPKDKYVTTDMPNIPNTSPYGIVIFYDNSKASQQAVKDVMNLFYKKGDIAKAFLISEGFTPNISFVKMDSELAKTYKDSIGKNVAEILTVFTEGEKKGYADKTQVTNLTAPSMIFYTSTGQLVSATKMTDAKGNYQKVVANNAKKLYKEILAMNSSLSNNTPETPDSKNQETSVPESTTQSSEN